MAQEAIRGCGFRKVGGLYLVGSYITLPCDRLPLEVGSCPTCGSGVHFSRNAAEINPFKLWGCHTAQGGAFFATDGPFEEHYDPCGCIKAFGHCIVCQPPDDVAFIMMVGEKYYSPHSFMSEARELGVSKRIPSFPRNLKVGKSVVYLGHKKAIQVYKEDGKQVSLLDQNIVDKESIIEYRMGIFGAFIPQRVEKLIWESEATPEVLENLMNRGITPVIIKDGDKDHK